MKTLNAIALAAAVAVPSFAAGAVATQPALAQMMPATRGEQGSARNILWVKTRLEAIIDSLQRDRRDYGGHREAAIDDLQRARVELQAAINFDAGHGH